MKATIAAAAITAAMTMTGVANADDPSEHVLSTKHAEGIPVANSSVINQSGGDGDSITTDTDRAILFELQRIRVILESGKAHVPCNIKVEGK